MSSLKRFSFISESIPQLISGSAITQSSHIGSIVCTIIYAHKAYIGANNADVVFDSFCDLCAKSANVTPHAPNFASIIVSRPSVIILRGNIHTSILNGLAR